MRILEEFWYGNIEPTEYDTSSCKEYSRFYFNNCYVFVQQCGQFISRKSFNVAQTRIAPRIGAEEYDKLIAGI